MAGQRGELLLRGGCRRVEGGKEKKKLKRTKRSVRRPFIGLPAAIALLVGEGGEVWLRTG